MVRVERLRARCAAPELPRRRSTCGSDPTKASAGSAKGASRVVMAMGYSVGVRSIQEQRAIATRFRPDAPAWSLSLQQ